MQIFVKTLKGTHFEIEVKPDATIADVKKNIETSQGQSVYPADQQMLIHQGKVLKDETTLAENNVADKTFIVVMLRKAKASSSGTSTTTVTPLSQPPPASSASANPPVSSQAPGALTAPASVTEPVGLTAPALASISPTTTAAPAPMTAAPAPMTAAPAPMTAAPVPTPAVTASDTADAYDQAASNLVAGNNLEQAIQQIIDMGGGTWDRETVVRAMRAAFNNPERAVEYLYSGIPEQAEVTPPVSRSPTEGQAITNPPPQAPQSAQTAIPSRGPNANPLNLFPQGLPSMGGNTAAGNLDFLRNSPQFRALQAMVQANPQILQPMLQELGRQNPQIMRLIQDHQAEFLRLINEPAEGGESNLLGQLGSSMPHALTVTPEEREAIERLEAMGFNRSLVLEVYFACNKNEELAANYLLDHMHEFDD